MPDPPSIECFEIGDDGRLVLRDVDAVIDTWRGGGGPFWIHVADPDSATRADVLGHIGLTTEVVDEILEAGHAPRSVPLDGGLFFEVPVALEGDPPEMRSPGILCLERLILTLGRQARTTGWTVGGAIDSLRLTSRTAGELAGSLMVVLSAHLRGQASELRHEIAAAAVQLDRDPQALDLDAILDLKRKALDLEAVVEERAAVLESVATLKHPILDQAFRSEFRVAMGNTTSTLRRAERLERRAADLQRRHDSLQQENINRRLSRLTVISAIFLPLTLVAGIYGMNFDVMPELHHPLGYPMVVGAMVVGGMALLLWFWFRGWMD